MSQNVVPFGSQTSSCPLLKLPPELRLLIYTYTHSFSLDLDVNETACKNLSEAWESTHLVRLATTCRLIANETRDFVRSLPSARRAATVDLLERRGPGRYVTIRVRHLPCPMIDLKHIVTRYNFEKYQSRVHGFPPTYDNLAVSRMLRDMGSQLLGALHRLMADAALDDAIKLNHVRLRIVGLRPRSEGESTADAVRRILGQQSSYSTIAERLVKELFNWSCFDGHAERSTSTTWLAVIGERSLLLL